MRAAYIAIEALTAVVMHVVKLAVYGWAALLTPISIATGLAIGAVMILGTSVGKRLLGRVPEHAFPLLVEAVLVVSGLQFLALGEGHRSLVEESQPSTKNDLRGSSAPPVRKSGREFESLSDKSSSGQRTTRTSIAPRALAGA